MLASSAAPSMAGAVDKSLGTAAPRHATGGVAPSTADPRVTGPVGSAGPPDSAVTGDPKAWILG